MKKSFIITLGLIIFSTATMPYNAFAEDETGEATEVTVEAEASAEESGVDEYDPPPPPDEDPDAPIDGGVALLIAGGIGYGVKKYRKGRKEKSKE